jgi:hypothetical protein
VSVVDDCIDGEGHVWAEEKEMLDGQGRIWITQSCEKCNSGSITLANDPAQSMEAFRDLLAVHQEHRG